MPSPDRRLRILTVTHNYPRFTGDPAGAFVARLARGAAARGHDVEVIAPHAPGTTLHQHEENLRLYRFRYGPDLLERVAYTGNLHQRTLRSPLAALAFPAFLLAFARAVRGAAARFRPDVIHAHWWLPSGWFVSFGATPYLMTCHGSDVRLLERGSVIRRVALPVFRKAARITAVSRFLADDIRRLLPALAAEIQVTPMPVDVATFSAGRLVPKHVPPRILYAGNLVASKGVDVLLRAIAELNRSGVPCELKILGEGPERPHLQALARQLGVMDRVVWAPFVPQSRMAAEYGASVVTVLPSRGRAEGLGLTLVEALVAGSAVVGTAAGGIPEVVIHEQTGLIAKDGDPKDLAAQLQRLLTDIPLRDRLSAQGREHALRTYSPDSAIARFLEIYDAVADHQPQR
ncbi:MAG TPA: glycosyltransferase [Gemmatimonadales bacterium]|nr:glycosyltransferase [Gemmatimonadales bacterium]